MISLTTVVCAYSSDPGQEMDGGLGGILIKKQLRIEVILGRKMGLYFFLFRGVHTKSQSLGNTVMDWEGASFFFGTHFSHTNHLTPKILVHFMILFVCL